MEADRTEFIRTVFKVYKLCDDATTAVVALYGSHPCIGEWKKEEALMVPYIGMSEWQVEAMLPKNTKLTYKLLLLHPGTKHVLQEELFERHLETGEIPKFVELTFDDMTWKSRPMKSKLTSTGSPIALHLPTVAIHRIGKSTLNTDYLMQDRGREKQGLRIGSSYHELAAALQRPEAAYDRWQAARQPVARASKRTQTENEYLAAQTPPSIVKPECTSVGVNTTEELLSTPISLGVRSMETVSKGVNTESIFEDRLKDGILDTNGNAFTIRQMLPSPYRVAMLGLAISACVFSKMKS